MSQLFQEQAAVLKVLAHPLRLQILEELSNKVSTVNALSKHLHKRQPNISQHLQYLRKVGLVFADKVGKQRVYQLDSRWVPILKQITECVK